MVFTWIFSQINNSYYNISSDLLIYFFSSLFPRLLEIIFTPIFYPEILWIILPLIIATILMMLYFGRYRHEELGWSTAFGNNIILLFVSINLLQHLGGLNLLFSVKAIFVYVILLYNIIQLFLNYFHKIPKYISFFLNSTIFINYIHFFAILIVYSNIQIGLTTFIAGIILFSILYAFYKSLWYFVPMSKGAKIFQKFQEKKIEKLKQKEIIKLKREELLDDKEVKITRMGIIIFLSLYTILFIINKFIINIEEFYLLILSAYFITYTYYHISKRKLFLKNLLFHGSPIKRDFGVLIGVLIFIYYIITTNLFVYVIDVPDYNPNLILLIINVIVLTISSDLFFRGVIQRGLKIKYGLFHGIIIQAFLWSLLKPDLFSVSLITIPSAIFGVLIIFPIGVLLGYIKEEWHFDSSLSASLMNSLLSIAFLVVL